MGHDIRIVDSDGEILSTYYLSGNFTELGKIYGGINQMHGHTGKTVAKIATAVILRLMDQGIRFTLPPQDTNWYWGVSIINGKIETLPDFIFKSVYIYHMCTIRMMGELYYNERFYSDEILPIIPYDSFHYEDLSFSPGEEDEIGSEIDKF